MASPSLIRTYRFRARHHYRRPEWTEEENRRAFGAWVEPHGHDYVVEVEVAGPLDEETGFVVDLGALDELLEEVLGGLDGGDLNEAIPEVREGRMIPSTEALARWLYHFLAGRIPAPARLERVRVAESDALASEFRASSP